MSITVYHNPRCSKSRMTVNLLEEHQIDFSTKLYMKEALSNQELESVIKALSIKPEDLLRKKEKVFIENFKGKDLSDKEIIQAMIDYPQLMERPIVVNNNKAVIGRPSELVASFLKLS